MFSFAIFMMQLYSFVTWPVYWLLQRPWKVRALRKEKMATLEVLNRRQVKLEGIHGHTRKENAKFILSGNGSLGSFVDKTCTKFATRRCFGYRQILGKSDCTFNGMPIKKISKSNSYKYLTYDQVLAKVNNNAKGMIHTLNVQPDDNVLVFGQTCMEWTNELDGMHQGWWCPGNVGPFHD